MLSFRYRDNCELLKYYYIGYIVYYIILHCGIELEKKLLSPFLGFHLLVSST